MRRGLLVLVTIIFLVHMADASPYSDLLDFTPPPGGIGIPSNYPDPDGLLSDWCTICVSFGNECIHYQGQQRASAAPVPTIATPFESSAFLSDTSWPLIQHSHSAPAAPEQPRWVPVQDQNLLHTGRTYDNSAFRDWNRTYNPGDRAEETTSVTSSQRAKTRLSAIKGGYTCDHEGCEGTFDRNSDLNRHKKIHIPEEDRPYQCPQCRHGFHYPKDLRRHEDTHKTGQDSNGPGYICDQDGCRSRTFTRKDNYNRHLRTKHSASSFTTVPSVSGTSTG